MVERGRVPLHRHRIAQYRLERRNVIGRELPQQQSGGLDDQTFAHNSALGSCGFNFCSSCHSSRTRRSRASGTIILISTISSPRVPSRVAEGTPFSGSRSFWPLWVPGGTLSCDRPSIVGTSIFAPRAASDAATGTTT